MGVLFLSLLEARVFAAIDAELGSYPRDEAFEGGSWMAAVWGLVIVAGFSFDSSFEKTILNADFRSR